MLSDGVLVVVLGEMFATEGGGSIVVSLFEQLYEVRYIGECALATYFGYR